jgi:exopolysaccharide biosynthesis polyprenyl glycosylphosphotransferase
MSSLQNDPRRTGAGEAGSPEEVRRQLVRLPVPPAPRVRTTAASTVADVPEARSAAQPSKAPVRPWPVYDPFSSRRRPMPEWLVHYLTALVVGDGLAALAAVVLTAVLSPGDAGLRLLVGTAMAGWPLLQAAVGSYTERRLGTGTDEYKRVLLAGLAVLAGFALVDAAAGVDARLMVLVAVPVGTALTVIARALNRGRLHAARRRARMTKRVVVVGREVAVVDLVRRLRRDTAAGLHVVGACTASSGDGLHLVEHGVPVLGDLTEVVRVLDEARADAVLVASASETAAVYLRDLAWRLEGTNIELLVAPGLVEVAPARMQVRPTTSVPLIQILEPEFRGRRRLVKALFDRGTAALLLLLSTPVFLALATAVKLSSPGPAFYRHGRLGKRGEEFDVLKFRSMRMGGPSNEELAAQNEGNDVQFKMRQDPRVTRVGAFLRRYSLDELPQLVNVLKGEMSLVGPRPHVAREVEQYGPDMHRRLLVKPGITGLWQVSGRSDLSWDDSVELDTRYVENWSIALDLSILLRTVRAVLGSSGAY